MQEVQIGKLTDIADGDYRIFAVDKLEVGIFRTGSKVLAYENVCPHAGGHRSGWPGPRRGRAPRDRCFDHADDPARQHQYSDHHAGRKACRRNVARANLTLQPEGNGAVIQALSHQAQQHNNQVRSADADINLPVADGDRNRRQAH